jgi:polyhydroxyalkanoate synthesis regulator phasin
MFNFLKKNFFTAIGLAVMTREKIEDIGKKIASEAKLSEIEGKQFVEELIKKTDETRFAIEKLVNEKIEVALKKLAIPTKHEIDLIENRVRKIEIKISEQENGC